jgi:hypothetical protein
MKKLALILVFGLLLSLTAPFTGILRAQDPAAADSLSQDDMAAPVLYNPEEEGEEPESSNEILWIGVAFVVVVGGYLVFKKSAKKK